ncbi:hypothetical protein F993_01475 [Acinetobacter proteolyticus]|uniref:Endonuclease/exonuclease/phosphatase domain-containing protein n=1 Tax=Acinetobacter proteolyticus TaxID=1776741 RepID=A0ABN0JG11_9GAMM|nr:endonuclease/exonuclease/phosphatase family protein [Acinetobacter proteolyticus]ENU24159.1 hypothetical protein F993_01475 [Acinetobacter proteolyticus]
MKWKTLTSMNKLELSIIFWNCGVSPTRGAPKDASKYQLATQLIYNMMVSDIDVICLVEVSKEFNNFLMWIINLMKLQYSLIDGTTKISRTRFDSCVIYKSSVFSKTRDIAVIKDEIPGATIKAGQVFFLQIADKELNFLVSHWPSQLNNQVLQREGAAKAVRKWIDDTRNSNILENLIFLGDYNSTPYSIEIKEILMSSYSKEHCIKHSDFNILYNPSWKLIYDVHSYHSGCIILDKFLANEPGTHYFPQNLKEEWHVYDQVLFPSSFVMGQKNTWSYIDHSLNVIKLGVSQNLSVWQSNNFDHLPVSLKLRSIISNVR